MSGFTFRCSSLGKLMTEPKTKADGPLSVGARTYIRSLAAQEIFGVDFIVTSKEMEKGIEVEPQTIALLNRVRGLSLVKNTERRNNDFITGECDLFDAPRRRGHDLKSSWSLATFPIAVADCEDKLYEWQMRGYMALWDADEWEVNYGLVDTPERLIRFEPLQLHMVGHIPEHHRLTTWLVKRDADKEAAMWEKVRAAREYFREVVSEFDRSHPETFADVQQLVDQGPTAPTVRTTAAPAANVVPMPTKAPAPAAVPTLKLGEINTRLAPVSIDAAGLAALGLPHSATDKSAKLWHEHQFPAICDALIAHAARAKVKTREAA